MVAAGVRYLWYLHFQEVAVRGLVDDSGGPPNNSVMEFPVDPMVDGEVLVDVLDEWLAEAEEVLVDDEPETVADLPWTNRAKVTAYAPGRSRVTGLLCGDSGRGTRSSTPTRWGVAATDRRVIPQWSLFEIEGLEGTVFRSEDTGSGVIGQHIDVWFPTCGQAEQWGMRFRAYRVLRWGP